MKKPTTKQLVTMIIAALIGAAVIAFPFIFNAVKRSQNDVTEVTLHNPQVMAADTTTSNPNLLKNGLFTDRPNGDGPFTPIATDRAIANYWKIPASSVGANNGLTATFETDADQKIRLQLIKKSGNYTPVYIAQETTETIIEGGKTYTVSAAVGGIDEIYSYTFTYEAGQTGKVGMGRLSSPGGSAAGLDGSFRIKTIPGSSTITTFQLGYNITSSNINATLIDYIYGVKVEEGTESTLLYDLVPPPPTYEDGYQDGFNNGKKEGYEEGFEEGKDKGYDEGFQAGAEETKKQYANKLIGGPSIQWKNNGTDAQYDKITDSLTMDPTTNAQNFVILKLTEPLIEEDGVIIEWQSFTTTESTKQKMQFTYGYGTGTESYAKISTDMTIKSISFTMPAMAFTNSDETTSILLQTATNTGPVTITGLKIYKVNEIYKNYYNGYEQGLKDGQAQNAENYNSGYKAGLAAGRAEDSESSNFGDLFTGIFGSLLSFFLTVGNGVTLWNMSLLQIVISFVAIFVIVKVVKNLV